MARFKEETFTKLTYLQWLSMALNRLTDLDGLVGPAMETLILTGWSVGICDVCVITLGP